MSRLTLRVVWCLTAATLWSQVPRLLSFDAPSPSLEPVLTAEPLGNGRALVRALLPIPDGMHLDLNLDVLGLEVSGLPTGAGAEALQWSQPGLRQGVPSFTGRAELSRVVYGLEAPAEVQVTVHWQICNAAGLCLLPESWTATVRVDPGPVLWGEIWLYLLFAFLGGLLLNAMPCILPLLALKASQLMNAARQSSRRRWALALAYLGGVLTAMLAAAALVLVARWTGSLVGWGMHLQNPVLLLGAVTSLWILALSLWGVFLLPALGLRSTTQDPRGYYLMGLGAVFVAAPCTAPFLGAAFSFAFALPAAALPTFFLAAGVGFALPLMALSLVPALRLPRGVAAWTEVFERTMAFVLAGFALSFLGSLASIVGAGGLLTTLAYLLGVSWLFFLMGRFGGLDAPVPRRRLVWALGLGLAAAGFGWVALGLRPSPAQAGTVAAATEADDERSGWVRFRRNELDRLLSAGTPVFVDIWAEWCTNCKINHATVLADAELLRWLDERGVVRMRGNLTAPDPEIQEWLREHRRAGLPVYAYYPPLRSQPVFLPEQLTVDAVKRAVAGAAP